MRIHPLTKAMTLAFCSAGLVACGGDDDDSSDGGGGADTTAEVRVVHASSDAPAVNAGLNGGGQVQGLEFPGATGFLSVEAGEYDVGVDGVLPPNADNDVIQDVISVAGLQLSADKETSIFAIGNVGDETIQALPVKAPDEDPASDQVRAQVVHASDAAAGVGDLDVYVTQPEADLSNADPLGTFGFKEDIGPATVPGGDYQIRVTKAGTPSNVVYDSGTVPLNGGSDLTIAAIDNTGPADGPRSAPIRLLVAPEGGDSFVLTDKGAKADIRAAHLSSNTGEVKVVANGDYNNPLLSNLTFPGVSNFTAVSEADYDIDVALTGSSSSAAGLDAVTLEGGKRYTAYAVGQSSGGSPSLELITSVDPIRSVATEGQLRVVHAASQVENVTGKTNGRVDVYLAAGGTSESEIPNRSPTLEDVEYKDITGYLSVAPGDYEVFVTAANETNAAISASLTLNAGDVKAVIARDVSGSNSFAALPVDDTP